MADQAATTRDGAGKFPVGPSLVKALLSSHQDASPPNASLSPAHPAILQKMVALQGDAWGNNSYSSSHKHLQLLEGAGKLKFS